MANMIGHYKIHRKIKNNPIWTDKPAWWLKVWMYLLDEAKFQTDKYRERGTNWFSYDKIYTDCCLHNDFDDPKRIQHLIGFLKAEGMILTNKVTRGFNITVCNYNKYQSLAEPKCDIDVTSTGHTRDTITKEGKNKEESIAYRERCRRIILHYKAKQGFKQDDRGWDAGNWARCMKAITPFKDTQEQDLIGAIDYTANKGFDNWKLETAMSYLAEYVKQKNKPETINGVPVMSKEDAAAAQARLEAHLKKELK